MFEPVLQILIHKATDPFFKSGSDRLARVEEKPSNSQMDRLKWILDFGSSCSLYKKSGKTDFGFWILDFGSAKVDFGSGCRFCMVAKIYDRSAFARNSKVIATNTTYYKKWGESTRFSAKP